MQAMSKLKLTTGLIFAGFYFITGVTMFILLIWSGGDIPHLALLGALSIVASYGLSKMKRWVLYVLTMLLFMGVTFGVVMVYTFMQWFGGDFAIISVQAVIVLYIVMLVVSFLDAFSKRKGFV
jgi:hypothetical protein